jgi:hypothetical protein
MIFSFEHPIVTTITLNSNLSIGHVMDHRRLIFALVDPSSRKHCHDCSVLVRPILHDDPTLASIQSYFPELLGSAPFNFTLISDSRRYEFNSDVLRELSSAVHTLLIRDPDATSFDLHADIPDSVMTKITSLLRGGTEIFDKSEYKSVKKIGAILQFGPATLPSWMTERRLRNMWRTFSTSKPETSVLSFLPSSITPFLVRARREFEIATKNTTRRISGFAVGLSPLLMKHRAAGHYRYTFEDDERLFVKVINFLNGDSIRITPETVEGFRTIAGQPSA